MVHETPFMLPVCYEYLKRLHAVSKRAPNQRLFLGETIKYCLHVLDELLLVLPLHTLQVVSYTLANLQ